MLRHPEVLALLLRNPTASGSVRQRHSALLSAEGELSKGSDDRSSEAGSSEPWLLRVDLFCGKCLAPELSLSLEFLFAGTLLAQDLPFQSHELEAAFGLRSTDPQFTLRHEIGLLEKPLAYLDLPPA